MKPTIKRRYLLAGVCAVLGLLVVVALSRKSARRGSAVANKKHLAVSENQQSESDQSAGGLSDLEHAESRTRHELVAASVRNEPIESPVTELAVHVSFEDGAAVAGIGVGIRRVEERPWASTRAATDQFGMAKFLPTPGRLVVAIDRTSSSIVDLAEGESRVFNVVLPRGDDIEGIVLTSERNPVEGARILLYDPKSELSPSEAARSDSEGRFSIRSVVSMTEVCAEAKFFSPSDRVVLQSPSSGYTHTVELVLGPPGGSLVGRVNSREGRAIAGALVTVGDWPPVDDPVVRADGVEVAPYLPRGVLTGSDGTFRSEGLASGPQSIRVQAEGYGFWTSEVIVPSAGRTGKFDIVLDHEAIVRGTISDSRGSAVPDVMVHREMPNPFHWKTLLSYTRSDGAFELGGLPSGKSVLFARKGKANVTTTVSLVPGQVLVWDSVIDLGLSVSGRVSVPVACNQEFFVHCWSMATGINQTVLVDPSGAFSFHALEPEPHILRVSPRKAGMSTCFQQNVNPGDPPLEIELDCALLASIRIVGQVVWKAGAVSNLRIVPVGPGLEGYTVLHVPRPDGSFDIGRYLPGRWRIEIRDVESNETLIQTQEIHVDANETLNVGALVVQERK